MSIIPLAHQAIRKLALIGLLLSPCMFPTSYAAELVGKPVPVGGQNVTESSASVSSTQSSMDSAADSPSAPVAPASPVPEVPEVPAAPDVRDDIHHVMEDVQANFHRDHDFDGFDMNPELIIPIVAMSLLFGGPVLLLIILAFLHYRAKVSRQQNINANIDKLLAAGRDIPIELLLGEDASAVKHSPTGQITNVYHGADKNMQKGVRNIGLGTGVLVFLTIVFGIDVGAFGFIFIGLGISQVVIWKLSGTSPVSGLNPGSTTEATRVQE